MYEKGFSFIFEFEYTGSFSGPCLKGKGTNVTALLLLVKRKEQECSQIINKLERIKYKQSFQTLYLELSKFL